MRIIPPRAALALTAALAAAAAFSAPTVEIFQKGKAFSERSVTIAAGEAIAFVNDDDHVHNVYSSTSGHAFDLGAQKPGDVGEHVFPTPGEVKVRCAIHPRMRLTVNVE